MIKKNAKKAPVTDLSRSPVARYIQLATLFRNRIGAGEWPVGSRIANVDDLAAEFSVARGTMREALGLLEREGLLERLRAKGTFVRKAPTVGRQHKLATDWQSVASVHKGADIDVLEIRLLPALPPLDLTKGQPAAKYRMIRRVHTREGRPYLLSSAYVEDELFRLCPRSQFRKLPTLPILHSVAGNSLAQAWQTLTVGTADVEVAALLKMPLNAPVAKVDRTLIDVNGIILYSGHGIYRGDTVSLEMELHWPKTGAARRQ
jgi:GntR family transcriptional regulator